MQSTFTERATPHDDAPKSNFWLTAAKVIALTAVAALCLTYGGFIIAAAAGVSGLVSLPLVASIAKLAFGWMAACVAGLFGIAALSISNSVTTVRRYSDALNGIKMSERNVDQHDSSSDDSDQEDSQKKPATPRIPGQVGLSYYSTLATNAQFDNSLSALPFMAEDSDDEPVLRASEVTASLVTAPVRRVPVIGTPVVAAATTFQFNSSLFVRTPQTALTLSPPLPLPSP